MKHLLSLLLLPLVLNFIHPTRAQTSPASRCESHPAYSAAWTSVLVLSWENHVGTGMSDATQEVYLPRHTTHEYTAVSPEPGKYAGLDLFHPARTNGPSLRMFFHRPALVYLFLDVHPGHFDEGASAELSGWKAEGWAKLDKGEPTLEYGVHNTARKTLSKIVYVFSKDTGDDEYVDVVANTELKRSVKGISLPGSYTLWIAEQDGSASPTVGAFGGKVVSPSVQCPQALHDAWVVADEPGDPDTEGKDFHTWHPKYDPCFWCAYDHDHGSSPKDLMGYEPRYGYTAWKNDRELEEHPGFKGFVFRQGGYLVYYSQHIQTSNLDRIKTRFHTVALSVVDETTKELVMDVSSKGDLGWVAVRVKGRETWRPIDSAQADIKASQGRNPVNFRSINVLDVASPDPEYSFRKPVSIGTYEFWRTVPLCAKPAGMSGITTIVRNPSTGIKSLSAISLVDLGRKQDGSFYKSTALDRSLRIPGMKLSSEYCPDAESGTFYTDATGANVMPGPGKNHIRQFIKPGFSLQMSGKFEPVDGWVGMYEDGARGFFSDHGFGIDPDKN